MLIKKLKNSLIIFASTIAILAPSLAFSAQGVVMAQSCSGITDNINKGVNTALGSNGGCSPPGSGTTNNFADIAKTIVNVFSIIVGVVAVIMIIYGGFRYITSGGESGAVGNAKNTIIYAIVGLILVALAQVIVHFVLNTANGATPGS